MYNEGNEKKVSKRVHHLNNIFKKKLILSVTYFIFSSCYIVS